MIYAIANDQYIKIGYTSRNIDARLAELQTGSSEPLRLVWLCESGTRAEEQALHRLFAAQRVRGEWFLATVLERLNPDFLAVSSSSGC